MGPSLEWSDSRWSIVYTHTWADWAGGAYVCNPIQKFSNWKLKTGLSKMKVWREKLQCCPLEQEKVVKEKM